MSTIHGDPLAWLLAVLLIYSIGVTLIADRLAHAMPRGARVAVSAVVMLVAILAAAILLPLAWSTSIMP